MSGMGERDTIFLAEMGIGPLWQLRVAPQPAATEAPAEAAQDVAAHAGAQAEQPAQQQAGQAETQAGPRADARTEPHARPAPPARAPAPDQAWGDITPYAVQGAAPPPVAPVEDEPVAAADISRMDWNELRAAIASCKRCGACRDGSKPVFGDGAVQARWLVAAGATTSADEQEGRPLAGEPGQLLDNMLFAVGLERGRDAYVTNLIKCRPASANGGDRAPTADEAAACRPFLERELALTGATAVLTLGQIATNALVGKPLQEPLAGARGSVHALGEVPLVATLHPGELLRRGADKALAWADLCRARAADGRGG